jgi:SAM-dependent methyltransferase
LRPSLSLGDQEATVSVRERFFAYERDHTERERFKTLLSTLSEIRAFIEGRRVLDFGASYGLSICALLETGANNVIGVEPDKRRVERGVHLLAEMGITGSALLVHTPDTRRLPFGDEAFDLVIANAVLEHIPQPRDLHVRELWRVVVPGGYMIVNETPNKYLAKDIHTTGLWFVPWMSKRLARRYAILRGRWSEDGDWSSSGWRGMGYFELVRAISRFVDESPRNRVRHNVLRALGFPPQILDPYPTLVLRKL